MLDSVLANVRAEGEALMEKGKYDYIGGLLAVIALMAFANGYLNANSVSPVWSGVSAAVVSPFIIVAPSIFVAGFIVIAWQFVSSGFDLDAQTHEIKSSQLQTLHWVAAIALSLFLDLGM